jgi:hypothetical protein
MSRVVGHYNIGGQNHGEEMRLHLDGPLVGSWWKRYAWWVIPLGLCLITEGWLDWPFGVRKPWRDYQDPAPIKAPAPVIQVLPAPVKVVLPPALPPDPTLKREPEPKPDFWDLARSKE